MQKIMSAIEYRILLLRRPQSHNDLFRLLYVVSERKYLDVLFINFQLI